MSASAFSKPENDIRAAEELLVDSRTGIVTGLSRRVAEPGLPAAWVGYSATVADAERAGLSEVDRFGFGAALGDPAMARAAALGEAVERYCGNQLSTEPRIAEYGALRAAGIDAVNPAELALYSAEQHASAGFPFVPFTERLPVAWVPGTDLLTGGSVFAPASLVYLNYFRGERARQPVTNPLNYAGIATGTSPAHATESALAELFERDATALWWYSGAPAIRIQDAEVITDSFADPETEGIDIQLFLLPGQFRIPAIAALIQHRGMIAFGTACRLDPTAAAVKAVVEAFAAFTLTSELANPDSELWRAVDAGLLGAHVFRPYRADQSYLDDFAQDLRELTDLPGIAQLYLDPRMRDRPVRRLAESTDTVRLADLAPRTGSGYLSELDNAGLRAVAVDVTTADVRSAGLHVYRVVVPGLYGNAPPAYPYLGGRRLYDIPVDRGWVVGPLTSADLVTDPIPLI